MRKNTILILFEIIKDFFGTIIGSIKMLFTHISGSAAIPLKESKFLDIMNFILQIGPKGFWKKPTGVKIGRSIATLIHYTFHKETYFSEKKK